MDTYLIVLLSVLGGAFVLTLLTAFVCYRMCFYHNRHKIPDTTAFIESDSFAPYREMSRVYVEAIKARPYEVCEIMSRDELRLRARYYNINEEAPVHILFHGYKSISWWDFSGGGEELMRLGHNVLLVDERAHCDSEGRTIGFGVLERHDLLAWCRYADERFGKDIFIWGISMGAATVLMSLDLPLPASVRAAVADCPYSSPRAIIKRVARNMRLPAGLLFPFVRLGAVLYGGFRLGNLSAAKVAGSAKIPVLLIHGEADNFVPIEMSEEIAKSAHGAGVSLEFHRFPDARHGLSFLTDRERYLSLVKVFINENTGQVKAASAEAPDAHLK